MVFRLTGDDTQIYLTKDTAAVGVLLLALAAAALMSASDSTPSDIWTGERPMEPLSAPRGPEPVSYGVGDAAFAA